MNNSKSIKTLEEENKRLREDAERFQAIMINQWLRPSKYHDSVINWKNLYLDRIQQTVIERRKLDVAL